MPRAKLFAGCLLLGLVACKHPSGANESSENLYGTDDPSGVLPLNPNAEVNIDMPEVPVRQAWAQGAKVLEIHRSATCPAATAEAGDATACGNETSYRFTRASRELMLSSCRCGSDLVVKKVTLSPAQSQELDKYVASLELASGPQVTCPPNSADTEWELILQNADSVEESHPVALCGNNTRQTGKINVRTFQALYEYLKKSLPE